VVLYSCVFFVCWLTRTIQIRLKEPDLWLDLLNIIKTGKSEIVKNCGKNRLIQKLENL